MTHRRTLVTVLAASAALVAAGCGDDSKDDSTPAKATTTTAAAAQGADLSAIKTYLLEHTTRLKADVATIKADAETYYTLAKAADFDYAALLKDKRSEVSALVAKLQDDFKKANPAYEEMEGVVAGVPSLADFDVIIDAGGDASDPENAVPFDVKTPAGKSFKQPGNFNFLIETAVFGTEPKFQAKGVEADLDGDGKVGFGEALPDADFLVAAARDFATQTEELDAAARQWQPTPDDAFNAVVVMTPTMSEYFEAWKNSRAISGSKATEKAFVAASRLQDIADILGGINLIYANIKPTVAQADSAQAEQTGKDLKDLLAFASKLEREEAGGKTFTAQDADTLGSEAQDRAEAIAGQVSQAAGRLNIKLAD